MTNTNPTQTQRIEEYLKTHDGITQFEAIMELGIMRLASRISEMRRNGLNITKETVTVTNRFNEKCSVARYRLAK